MKELEAAPVQHCANCQAPLHGHFCHECGQSVHSVLRPMSHMLEDAGDIFFHMDERIVHTVPPLFTRPGFLTLEYFSGRRVRYIAPFRLMFVFCLLAFFFVHLNFEGMAAELQDYNKDDTSIFAKATTPEQVHELYQAQDDSLRLSQEDDHMPAQAKAGLERAREAVRDKANERLVELKAPPMPAATGDASKAKDDSDENDLTQWLHSKSSVTIGWLPTALNQRLSVSVARFKANLLRASSGGPDESEAIQHIVEGVFGVLPQTMFVMVPLFALVLKIFYWFRRRLYMEHLIVALHSHAFLFFALLLMMLLGFAREAIAPHVLLAARGIRLVQWAIFLWMPIYLLLMQKRVYRQGWGMTIFKYWLIGSVYFWLLGFALAFAMLIGLSH
ncbi:DUF3667 domain-containing protein [Luteibacter aegosomatis]|uniref:DUF3667 domain-containing protein n=1 Tax=Luteibacter aegosomatis TaxID=2911537 RepID=UPI001FFAD431|nr:DUF3667 domain-containing protein [Luteibacter aegosomatis]UPG85433.1 DUF3667 domain-containing protein [Luteibacter aegosomatis]